MKKAYFFSVTGIALFSSLSFSLCSNKNNTTMSAEQQKGFAVVELFTSEGCSSCPPADEAMIRLAKEFPENVYFLGYHVDYWDYIGWKDPFSSGRFTERQREYSNVFHLSSIYTPQAVVNGEKEVVGSRESQLRNLIKEELKDSSFTAVELSAMKEGDRVTVTYKIAGAPKRSDLHIVLVQKMATTKVKRGENSGHTLNHVNIVREFETVSLDKDNIGTATLTLPDALTANDLKIIAFVQERNTLKISGAGMTGL